MGCGVKKLSLALALSVVFSLFATSSGASEDLASLAQPVARGPLSGDSVYFVMTDRFANGDTSNDGGGLTGGRLAVEMIRLISAITMVEISKD
jgi:hypothetical protein